MAGIREDYIERMIKQLVSALAAIAKAGRGQKTDEALELVRQTSLSLFGMEYRTLITFDAASVAELLGTPERILALVRLLSAEADLLEQRGDMEGVAHRLGHALALARLAQARKATPEGEALLLAMTDRLSALCAL